MRGGREEIRKAYPALSNFGLMSAIWWLVIGPRKPRGTRSKELLLCSATNSGLCIFGRESGIDEWTEKVCQVSDTDTI